MRMPAQQTSEDLRRASRIHMFVALALALVWLMTVLQWFRKDDPLDAVEQLSSAAALLLWLILRPRGVAKVSAFLRSLRPE